LAALAVLNSRRAIAQPLERSASHAKTTDVTVYHAPATLAVGLVGGYVHTDAAAMLVGMLAGERPAGGDRPVATVVIPGDGAGDQSVGSPGVKVLVGWAQA